MSLKRDQIWAIAVIIGIIILLVALIKGCHENRGVYAKYKKLDSLNTALLNVINEDKYIIDSTQKAFQDTLEFERGQNALIEAQKQRTEEELDQVLKQNKELLDKHKLAQYTDTTATLVPHGFIVECEGCFSRLESTTNLTLKYKSDYTKLKESWDRQDKIYQSQLKSIVTERQKFNLKIESLAKQQQEYIDKAKPRGRLYLSWGVLWSPWPIAVGGGFMYQNKRNLIYGLKGYYGRGGTTVESTINFPLSLRFR